MAFPVKKEPDDLANEVGGVVENCFFCNRQTKYWHEKTNNPVCPECSTSHNESELHNWRKAGA